MRNQGTDFYLARGGKPPLEPPPYEPPAIQSTTIPRAMPRRKKTPEEKREKEIKVRMSEAEYQHLQGLAAAAGEPEAVYCRRMALQNPRNPPPIVLVPPANTQIWREMNRPLSNLNQFLRILYRARAAGIDIPDGLLKLAEEEYSALKSVRAQLIGETVTDGTGEEQEL